ncbi:MAG: tautomerase family protein [Pseudomonadota bacterium]
MPLYLCNFAKGAIEDAAKAPIAADITQIHCDVTGAPPSFVHVFFLEDAAHPQRGGKKAIVSGTIRAGRTHEQKQRIAHRICEALSRRTGLALADLAASTADTPSSWVMEGGEVMPEPGEEANWLAARAAGRVQSDAQA